MQPDTSCSLAAAPADAFQTTGTSPTRTSSTTATVRVALPGGRRAKVPFLFAGPVDDDSLTVVLGGISAGRQVLDGPDARGWWASIVGPGAALDPERDAILSFDFLGSSAAQLILDAPATGARGAADDAGGVTTYDQAEALAQILAAIGRERCRIVGASYGGMVALAFAERYPDACERLVVLCAAHRAHPMATGWRALQRQVVRLGRETGRTQRGVEIARAMAMTSYRSPAEFERRFASGSAPFPVESYLDARGEAFAADFDDDAYLRLSESIDTHRVDPAAIRAPVHLLAVDQDALVPPWLVDELRRGLGGPVDHRVIESAYGHDAFLKEHAAVTRLLDDALRSGPAAEAAAAPQPAPRACSTEGASVPAAARRVTGAVRAGIGDDDAAHGAVMPPLYLSANYTFESFGVKRPHDYTRTSNPTRDQLAEALANLEGGARAVVTSSGMSAVALVLQLLRPGDRVVATRDGYGGSYRLLCALQERLGIETVFVDLAGPEGIDEIRRLRPRLVWVETPSNPLLRITDLAAVAEAAHEVGARVGVDNTLLSPALQRPLEHGADIVVHSTTKFLNGHSDVVGGAAIAADANLGEELAWWSNCLGLAGAPFDAYLTLRGLRTLDARVRVHQDNAAALVQLLTSHPAVQAVHYPGLADHPSHTVAARQQDGFGSLVSFELAGGAAATRAVIEGLRCFSLAESLGGVESLVSHPATMTHAAMEPEARESAGIGDDLVRLSVGIEAADDLRADLRAALDRAAAVGR